MKMQMKFNSYLDKKQLVHHESSFGSFWIESMRTILNDMLIYNKI